MHEAEDALSQLDEPWLDANLLAVKGLLLANREEWAQAATAYATSLAIDRRLGDPAGQYEVLGGWELMELWQGRYDRAATMAEEALAHITAVGQGAGIGMCLMELGTDCACARRAGAVPELLESGAVTTLRASHLRCGSARLAGQGRAGARGPRAGTCLRCRKPGRGTGTSAIRVEAPHRPE